jgi:hypothetical protein
MSVVIDNTEDLMTLLKKLGLKVASVDELRQLLATINANYNPDAARARIGKLIGVSVPSVMAGCAAVVSFTLAAPGHDLTPYHVAVLASIWGVCGLVSVVALIVGFILASGRRGGRSLPDSPHIGQQSSSDPLMTAITDRLR